MDNAEMGERLIVMETKMCNYENEIKDIKKSINSINTQLSRIGWGLAATFGGLMFQLLVMVLGVNK